MTVYLICAEIDGTIDQRIKEFKTGNASEFYTIDSFESKWGSKIESHLHKLYKNKRVNREWFNLDDEDISKFNRYCESYHNNLEIISTQNTYYLDFINK